jgi:hypothetical protein
MTGKLTRYVPGANHAQLIFVVVDSDGSIMKDSKPLQWGVETGSAAAMSRAGRDAIRSQARSSRQGSIPLRDGRNRRTRRHADRVRHCVLGWLHRRTERGSSAKLPRSNRACRAQPPRDSSSRRAISRINGYPIAVIVACLRRILRRPFGRILRRIDDLLTESGTGSRFRACPRAAPFFCGGRLTSRMRPNAENGRTNALTSLPAPHQV